MTFSAAKSRDASQALTVIENLQKHFADRLLSICNSPFKKIEWLRDLGQHGGGHRLVGTDENTFNRAAINFSQVHYDDDPQRKLSSATALSTIIHPKNPLAPSIHMHLSYTVLNQDKRAYWRIMADLNPSNKNESDTAVFLEAIEKAAGTHFQQGIEQGDKYFNIPTLSRHRGVAHFYLEEYQSGNFDKDSEFACDIIKSSCNAYVEIVKKCLEQPSVDADLESSNQLAYHTLYLFQVLTLDRGTIFGLIVHDQNDVGILGSLPSHIDRSLLTSWLDKIPSKQKALLQTVLDALPKQELCVIDNEVKLQLAKNIRHFYKKHPEAIDYLAKADIVPTTTDNHLNN